VVSDKVISNKGEKMTYLIGRWYIKMFDGKLEPCQNYGTAKYYVDNGLAEAIVDPTGELMRA
jgi:hypothetical protein